MKKLILLVVLLLSTTIYAQKTYEYNLGVKTTKELFMSNERKVFINTEPVTVKLHRNGNNLTMFNGIEIVKKHLFSHNYDFKLKSYVISFIENDVVYVLVYNNKRLIIAKENSNNLYIFYNTKSTYNERQL